MDSRKVMQQSANQSLAGRVPDAARPVRLAIVVTHPIQHFVHLYRALAREPSIDLKVFYCSRIGLDKYFDREMQTEIAWAGNLTDGYGHEFLPEAANIRLSGLFEVNNPSVGPALAAFAPDAVMLYGYATLTTLRALAWCRWNQVPVLMTGDGEAQRRRGALKAVVRSASLRLIFAQVSAFLTVGDQNEEMLAAEGVARARMYRTPFTIDENSYMAARVDRLQLRRRLRNELGLAEDEFVVLFVGKLSARKRPRDLLDAWRKLKDQERTGTLRILYCGNGEQREALEQSARENSIPAIFAGFVNVDRLPSFYCAADVLVHPSEHDPHPLICSEAACIGLPMILSSAVGAVGKTDVAREGVNTLIVPCADISALADAMARLANDKQLYTRLASASPAVYDECNLAASLRGIRRALASIEITSGARLAPGLGS